MNSFISVILLIVNIMFITSVNSDKVVFHDVVHIAPTKKLDVENSQLNSIKTVDPGDDFDLESERVERNSSDENKSDSDIKHIMKKNTEQTDSEDKESKSKKTKKNKKEEKERKKELDTSNAKSKEEKEVKAKADRVTTARDANDDSSVEISSQVKQNQEDDETHKEEEEDKNTDHHTDEEGELHSNQKSGSRKKQVNKSMTKQKFSCQKSTDCQDKYGLSGAKCSKGLCHVQKHCKTNDNCSKGFQCLPDGNSNRLLCMRKKSHSDGDKVSKVMCSTNSDCQRGFDCVKNASKSDENKSNCVKSSAAATNDETSHSSPADCSAIFDKKLSDALANAKQVMDYQLTRALQIIQEVIKNPPVSKV